MPRPRTPVTRSEPMHQQIARHIRTEIEAGVLRNGQALPSTRQLAEEWGVSAFTINEALALLIKEGIIQSRARSGRIVTAPDQARRELRTSTPQVVLVGGYAGCGKTELGRILARATGWPILDKDTLTRPVVEIALETLGESPNTRESETYLRVIRPAEYEALLSAMTENVQCGTSVIVTAPFLREFADPAWLDRTSAACKDMNAAVHLVWVYCDADSMRGYLRHRGAARDTAKLRDWDSYLAANDLDFRPPVKHVVIDNSQAGRPLQDQAAELLRTMTETAGV
jgi:DNA-binding transcriptional regulator YhcF (GntR family)